MASRIRPALLPSWIALLALCALCQAADGHSPPAPAVTKAPIFLPYYHEEAWSVVRGSILSRNKTASETTYTIFCPTETPPACDLSLEFPFVIVEGPGTLRFHGTYTSTYIANLECRLNGTTAATCSGYSSYKAGYANGLLTGPTEMSWTSTLTGTDVEWGTLVMADNPKTKGNNLHMTAAPNSGPASAELYAPKATGQGAGARIHVDERLATMASVLAICAVGLW
ncbi:hypothetical protein HRG_003599 [Hirsutella rhossiliensis]|uniref:Uncharacterized protein n=1 Tax=Hirsutella rhossiliensis TaxID=111463 RepID=A0A9P8SJR8_9HYPO|nr:uncharacterized protein HRG_03599 [Hirsutella rhossiliensis]KAH0965583.1 hypothetical protein HRG_03599 [Hirsutella rhossiliensis]